MRLDDLTAGIDVTPAFGSDTGWHDLQILGVTSDSRAVKPGYAFVAIAGGQQDGLDYAAAAVENGAVTVIGRSDPRLAAASVPGFTTASPRQCLAQLAARFYPRRPACCVAVTGTNGKSSVVDFTRQIWRQNGCAAASLGTLGVIAGGGEVSGTSGAKSKAFASLAHTTPDSVDLHQLLQDLADHDIRFLALEASSHGLDQNRLDGMTFNAAAFTSFSRDHLDYHASAEEYLNAKLRLLRERVSAGGVAVINASMVETPEIAAAARDAGLRVALYGSPDAVSESLDATIDYAIEAAEPAPFGMAVRLRIQDAVADISLPLVGRFQAENAVAALALTVAGGLDLDQALVALPKLTGVPGRLQFVGATSAGGHVYVDYSHTPDSLKHALQALRPHTSGKLVVVFGCGGDRDKGKRPEMGRVTVALADRAILTDDNPRTEDPAGIRADVLTAAPEAKEIADRDAAIAAGLEGLQTGDCLLIAGKGHESGQIVGDRVLPFNDAEVAARHIAAGGGETAVQA